MSDRKKNSSWFTRCGILLTVISVMLCLIPGIRFAAGTDMHFRHNAPVPFYPQPIETSRAGIIRINEADAEELQEISGIGDTLSGMILQERLKNGPFFYPEDLVSVKGIGMQKLNSIKGYLDFSCLRGGDH